jgi:isopenicillin N synthase-like dioxygenase
MEIPLIDVSDFESANPAKCKAVAAKWGKAFETVGFASIVGHGISERLLDDIYAKAQQFFDQPLEVKMRWHLPSTSGVGYAPIGTEAVARSMGDALPPDLSEALQFLNCHLDAKHGNIWPDSPPNFRETVEEFVLEAAALERRLMRISAVALGLAEVYFEPYYDQMTTKLRLVHYPDQPDEPLPGQLRNAAHTDFGGFTILRQDDAPGGLQVKFPNDQWADVKPIPGALVINAGDLIQRWTNDRWHSNLHRVINPPRGLTGSTRRISIVLFTGPNPDTVVSCLPTCCGSDGKGKYPPINATEHVRERVRQTYSL